MYANKRSKPAALTISTAAEILARRARHIVHRLNGTSALTRGFARAIKEIDLWRAKCCHLSASYTRGRNSLSEWRLGEYAVHNEHEALRAVRQRLHIHVGHSLRAMLRGLSRWFVTVIEL